MAFATPAAYAGTVDTATATSTAVNLPTGISAGDLLLIGITGSATDATPNTTASGWTTLFDLKDSSSASHLAILYRIATGGEGATATVSTDLAEHRAAVALRYTGWHGTTPPEVSTGSAVVTANPDPDSVTASWGSADNLFVAFATGDNNRQITAYPSGYSIEQHTEFTGTTAGGCIGVAHAEVAAASADPGPFTISSSNRSVAATVVIRPASGPTASETMGGAITPTGTVALQVTEVILVGTLVPSGTVSSSTSGTGVVSVAGAITPTGDIDPITVGFADGAMVGTITPTGSLSTQQTLFSAEIAGDLTMSGALVSFDYIKGTLSGSITPTGGPGVPSAFLHALAGAITPTGTVASQDFAGTILILNSRSGAD